MANDNLRLISQLLGSSVEVLDISAEQYELAVRRYEDLGWWLVAQGIGDPDVYPQGSFRLGTVVRPTINSDFDIDLVFLRYLAKESITQTNSALRRGSCCCPTSELAETRTGTLGSREKGRCWTLVYTNDKFHMDVLPVIPDPDGDDTAILLSDRDLSSGNTATRSDTPTGSWRSMGDAVEIGRAQLATTLSRDVEDVPRWLVRTTLQRVVQLLSCTATRSSTTSPETNPPPFSSRPWQLTRTAARATYTRRTGRSRTTSPPISNGATASSGFRTQPTRRRTLQTSGTQIRPAKRHFDRWAHALTADADRWIGSAGIDEAVRSLGAALPSAAVQAGAKRVGLTLSSATASGALAVTQRGRLTHGRGTKIPRHDFHGQ